MNIEFLGYVCYSERYGNKFLINFKIIRGRRLEMEEKDILTEEIILQKMCIRDRNYILKELF